MSATWRLLTGDCRDALATLDAGSVQTCVTSPPYFGLRSYGDDSAEIGKEPTPDEFVAALVDVFRAVRRVLRDDGTVWLNPGDSYAATVKGTFPPKLIEPCILAGSAPGDTILDPFAGAGTTGMVALRYGRSFIGCELNPKYVELARERIRSDAPLWNPMTEVA